MKPNTYELPWRPTTEGYAAAGWLLGGTSCLTYGVTHAPQVQVAIWMASACFLFGAYRLFQSIKVWERKYQLNPENMWFMSYKNMKRRMLKDKKHFWAGCGFIWGATEANMAFHLQKTAPNNLAAPRAYQLLRRGKIRVKRHDQMGASWIHGLGNESDVMIPEKHLGGHTLLAGTTGAGKSVMMNLLVSQAVAKGHVVIVIDPKGDPGLRKGMETACHEYGRPEDFINFHPAHVRDSVRLDPMHNFNRETELASRIAALIPSADGMDAFVGFGWRTINIIVRGLTFLASRPNLKRIMQHIQNGPEGLLEGCLRLHLNNVAEGWETRISEYVTQARKSKPRDTKASDALLGMILYYQREIETVPATSSKTINGLISMFTHSREHAGKMLASLLPILEMLTAGELGDLLSPDYEDVDDPRPITDMASVIEQGRVLYVGTDTLSDQTVGSALGSILLADLCAVAGSRYNYLRDEDSPTISLFVDESAEVFNPPLLMMLNKARGAKFHCTLATQALHDIEARLGSQAAAFQVLANLNNTIAMRLIDSATQEYMTEKLGKTSVLTAMHEQKTQSMGSDKDVTTFSTGYGERLVEDTDADLFPAQMFSKLPDMHYVAVVSGGRVIKGRVPILLGQDISPHEYEPIFSASDRDSGGYEPASTPDGYTSFYGSVDQSTIDSDLYEDLDDKPLITEAA